MSYACLNIQPMRMKDLAGLVRHNTRAGRKLDNVDPKRTPKNQTIGMNLDELKKAIPTHQPDGKKIRSDATHYAAIVLQPSPDWNGDFDDWAKQSLRWLRQKCPGKMCRIDYHLDEKTRHIHALIQPIDESGKLNYTKLFGRLKGQVKSPALDKLHDSYAQAMKHLGLKRGDYGSERVYRKRAHIKNEKADKAIFDRGFEAGAKAATKKLDEHLRLIERLEAENQSLRAKKKERGMER